MNTDGTSGNISAEAVPSREEFEDQRAELGSIIRAGGASTKQLLAHRALTDYWNGKCERSALMNRLEHIEAR